MVIKMEVNLKELIKILLRKWWIVLICVLISGGTAIILTNYYMVPVYQANTTLYVGKNADEQGMNADDLNIGASVVLDYSEIAKSRLVASTVISELGLTNMIVDELTGRINVEQRTETRVIEIYVTDTDPQMAMLMTNKVADVFQRKIIDIMKVANVQVIDKAELPLYPVSPNMRLNFLVGIILGLILGLGIIAIIEYLDDTVKTPEDIKKYVNLPVIGAIPVFQAKGKGA